MESFRYQRNLYGFSVNVGSKDQMSLDYSKDINIELTEIFINQPKNLIGYKGHETEYEMIDDLDSINKTLKKGIAKRAVEATAMNDTSSRSHTIFK